MKNALILEKKNKNQGIILRKNQKNKAKRCCFYAGKRRKSICFCFSRAGIAKISA